MNLNYKQQFLQIFVLAAIFWSSISLVEVTVAKVEMENSSSSAIREMLPVESSDIKQLELEKYQLQKISGSYWGLKLYIIFIAFFPVLTLIIGFILGRLYHKIFK